MARLNGFHAASRVARSVLLATFALLWSAPHIANAAGAAESIAHGDELYAKGRLADAYAQYAVALQAEPASYHALCRMARAESELGEDASGEERRRLIAAAVEHARSAVRIAPDSAQGHVWLAVALGRQALKEGPKGKLALAREIKSEADRALALDPDNGRAYHVRAIWNREVASLNFFERAAANTVLGGVPAGASMDNAVRDLQKAIALEPDYVNHRLELGRTFRMLKRWDEARRELEKAIALPPTSNSRDPKFQDEARELLSHLPKKG